MEAQEPTSVSVEVTQADREALNAYFRSGDCPLSVKMVLGYNPQPLLEVLARHRQQADQSRPACALDRAEAIEQVARLLVTQRGTSPDTLHQIEPSYDPWPVDATQDSQRFEGANLVPCTISLTKAWRKRVPDAEQIVDLCIALQPASIEGEGWIIGDGGKPERWCSWQSGMPEWIDDRTKATRYARREDAENVHLNDDDAWTVERYSPSAATVTESVKVGPTADGGIEGEATAALRVLVEALDGLIADSSGVYGLHLNGDVAPWSDITLGGAFEEWLSPLEDARAVLSNATTVSPTADIPAGMKEQQA